MPKSIMSKVRGVSHKNDDGSSRQAIIKKFVDPYSEIILEHDVENKFSETAVAVYVIDNNSNEKQIGFLSEDLAGRYYNQLNNIDCFVEEVTGEEKSTLGVNIRLVVYTDEEIQERAVQKKKVSPPPVITTTPPAETKPIRQVEKHTPSPTKKEISQKSRTIALVLCVLFGYFGAHHFYAGRKGIGVLYIFTVGGFIFGWAIDFILILLGRYKDKSGRIINSW